MKVSHPTISIIIAVFNMQDRLAAAIESVLKQTYAHWELLILDGGSTDDTVGVIKKYEQHLAFWQSEKDKGHIDACNKALPKTRGEWICLLNADDILLPDSLEKIARTSQNHPACQVITGGVIIKKWQDNRIVSVKTYTHPKDLGLTLSNVLLKMPFINARFFHKTLFAKYGNFCAINDAGQYYISNDREYLSRLALLDISSVIISDPVYEYHAHDGSLTFSNKHRLQIHREHCALATRLLGNPSLTVGDRKLISRWQTKETLLSAFFLLKKQPLFASQLLLGEIKSHPLQCIFQFFRLVAVKCCDKLAFLPNEMR
ncbi:MAG TPA: glycosyltransferase [Gammaproteobacteria bacterium]|jgi:glycosyltransferase involved in cell wall biosynthesis|nr:glycosyltransferase [Gammaproteobacteria bacterium]